MRPLTQRTRSGAIGAAADRASYFPDGLPEEAGELTLAQAINAALTDVLATCQQAIAFGEDVGVKGGVYGVTRGLQKRFGAARVFDTLLDEQTILGGALGSALAGLLPIPEIQYLAYLHNAEDQLRGEAATLRFFSDGQYANGMVVRVPGLAYQKGFGGHFHNDNSRGGAARHPRHPGRLSLERRRGARAAAHPGRARGGRGTRRRAAGADRALSLPRPHRAVRRRSRPGPTSATAAGCTPTAATCSW